MFICLAILVKNHTVATSVVQSSPASVALRNHNFIHMDVRAFNCVHCDKSFMMYIQLYNHVQLHTCPFKCEDCSRGFGSCCSHQTYTDMSEELQ
jgi:hypothetical protein